MTIKDFIVMGIFFGAVCAIPLASCWIFHRLRPQERWSMKLAKGGLASAAFWGIIYCSGWLVHIPATNTFLGTLGAALTLGMFWGWILAFLFLIGAGAVELILRIKSKSTRAPNPTK